MKKLLKSIGIIAAVCCMFSCVPALIACGGGNSGNNENNGGNGGNGGTPEKTIYTVTFESNGGSAVEAQKVEEGGFATKPATDPEKAGSIFSGWCKDQALEVVFEFETEAITANTTVYASWAAAGDTSVAKFHWNYQGATEELFATKTFANGARIADPGNPSRSGFYFAGWYTEDGTVQYTKMKKFTGNQDFYAKWQTIYTFEAEKTQLTGLTDDAELGLATEAGAKLGHNFSGEANGVNLIKGDNAASGGKYVSGLFYNGAYLQFEFTSDKAVTGATLRAVLSCEYADIKLTTKTYNIYVNGTKVKFDDISLGNGTGVSTDPGPRGGFKELYIANIDLKQGANVIKLEVNNDETPAGEAGTVDAASPSVDCIKIYTDAVLAMTEYENK